MNQIKLKFHETRAGTTYCYKQNREYFVPPKRAEQFVEQGAAEYVEKPKKKKVATSK